MLMGTDNKDVFPSYLKDFTAQAGLIQTGVSILTLPNEKTLPQIKQTVVGALCLSGVLKDLKQLDYTLHCHDYLLSLTLLILADGHYNT